MQSVRSAPLNKERPAGRSRSRRESLRRTSAALEIEVVDIRRIERGRWSKHDFAALAHRALAQFARVKAVAFLARDRARREVSRRVRREVTELTRVPQLQRLHGAVLDERAHLVRRTESSDHDTALGG